MVRSADDQAHRIDRVQLHWGNELPVRFWNGREGYGVSDIIVIRVVDLPAETAQVLGTKIADGLITGRHGDVIDSDVTAVPPRDESPGFRAHRDLHRRPVVLGSAKEDGV